MQKNRLNGPKSARWVDISNCVKLNVERGWDLKGLKQFSRDLDPIWVLFFMVSPWQKKKKRKRKLTT